MSDAQPPFPVPKYHPADTIPADHWSLKVADEDNVALFRVRVKGEIIMVRVMVNPTDRRGFRTIVKLHARDLRTTLNRRWREEEVAAVFRVGAFICSQYAGAGMTPQMYFAGNNAMEQLEDGTVMIGRREPAICHVHILGRGNPKAEHVPELALCVPPVGEEFNLKGNGDPEQYGKKLPWSPAEKKIFCDGLRVACLMYARCDKPTDDLEAVLDEEQQ